MPPYIHPNAKSKQQTRPSTSNLSQTANEKRKARFQTAPTQKDPLLSAGLPSKGDTTLLNHAAQEAYYTLLTSRYMDWCAATGNPSVADTTTAAPSAPSAPSHAKAFDADLSASFGDMSLDESFDESFRLVGSRAGNRSSSASTSASTSATGAASRSDSTASTELSNLHLSMRKLREALLSTGRVDLFAQQVYVFITRASLLSGSFESYQPALLHLLYVLHPSLALSVSMLHEFVGYLVLDTACRLGDYAGAYALRVRWGFVDGKVDAVLRALVRDDWVGFWRVRDGLDGYQRALVRWAEDGVRRHVLKCVGGAYLNVSRKFVERGVGGAQDGAVWSDVVRLYDLKWEQDGDMLVIRRIKTAGKKGGK